MTSGNASTRLHVAPLSPLRQSPAWRVPRKRILPSFGSTAMRSPLPRPFSLPPILNGTSVRSKLRPRSRERRMAPLGACGLV